MLGNIQGTVRALKRCSVPIHAIALARVPLFSN